MEIGWETRPLSIVHKPREWEELQNGGNHTAPSKSSLISKRRSAAVHAPPPGPPPTQPIPQPPPTQQYEIYDGLPPVSDRPLDFQSGSYSPPQAYVRPAASANLAAVAAFSQARHVKYSPASTAASSTDNLSDSPPASRLKPGNKSPTMANEIVPDRLLLSPSGVRSSEQRPSSRRALTKALELAREAVKLDSTNDDPYGAVIAYGKSVALLSEVMERVMRGEDTTESHRRKNGRRRSVVAQEEEVRRLKSIHDTYADRMNILSVIYSIPLPTTSPPSSAVSISTTSTQPSSPSSTSPTSDSSEASSSLSRQDSQQSLNAYDASASYADVTETSSGLLAIGTALFNMETGSAGPSPRTPVGPPIHPYAAAPAPSRPPPPTPPRSQVGRPRAPSSLPPLAPPPTTLLPPAPAVIEPPPDITSARTLKPLDVSGRQRGHSISHKRTGSATKLAALHEEQGDHRHYGDRLEAFSGDVDNRPRSRSSQRDVPRESHPLPPLPSPVPFDLTPLPRGAISNPESPKNSAFSQRPRGGSTFSVRSDLTSSSPRDRDQPPLINASPTSGTISQRRNKTSAPPSTSSASSPTESILSSATVPIMNRPTPTLVPNLSAANRQRAESQPVRRTPTMTNNSYPFPPQTAGPGGQPRKVSVPSPLNPKAPPAITINHPVLLSPPLSKPLLTPLVPPPPIPHGNIPVAPLSPLPPMAPPDPLRKPYHMMILLRQTMTSKTGGYITRRLHVPQEVWSQGGAKLNNVPEKIRVVEVLSSALEEIQSWSVEYFGAGNVSSGMAMGIGSIGKKEAEMWSSKLEEFSSVCDGVVSNFGKKLGVGEGFVTKKSSGGSFQFTALGGRLTRQFDKLTNAKNLDSPALYVQVLSKLFNQAQILDEHTKAVSMQPMAPLYVAFPPDVRTALEIKLRRASEFFAKVILTFVIRDMALLLDKYVKKCEKWLAE
ncbi:hypothetical protein BDW22DRAFT_1341710 [Trametopsis cervina]|nr:hypothetical protein BDW22DRAFT_1341710 [Trametopsis cervina]